MAFAIFFLFANVEKDYRWVVRHALEGTAVRNRSDETALLAVQGPASAEIIAAGDSALPSLPGTLKRSGSSPARASSSMRWTF